MSTSAPWAEIMVGENARIEADRDEPRDLRAALTHLFDGKEEFLVLVTLAAAEAAAGEAGQEDDGVVGYGLTYLHAPVLTRP